MGLKQDRCPISGLFRTDFSPPTPATGFRAAGGGGEVDGTGGADFFLIKPIHLASRRNRLEIYPGARLGEIK